MLLVPLIDPYLGTPKKQLTRLQTRVDTSDYNTLRILTAERGIGQAVCNRLIKCLLNTLENHGIRDYTQVDELKGILDRHFPAEGVRSATPHLVGEGGQGHVTGGTGGVRKSVKKQPIVAPNPSSGG